MQGDFMEQCKEPKDMSEAILAFDTLYTNNHMKILKLLMPLVDSKHQKMLAIYIKWQELVFTLDFFKHYSVSLYTKDFLQQSTMNIEDILPLVTPYCNKQEQQILNQFGQMKNMMNMMDNMQQYMPLIQQFMSSMSGDNNSFGDLSDLGSNNMMDMLKNMMSEEQQTMFSMFMDSTTE